MINEIPKYSSPGILVVMLFAFFYILTKLLVVSYEVVIIFFIGLLPFIFYMAISRIAIFCSVFFVFSVFRLHEVSVELYDFRIPFFLALIGSLSLIIKIMLKKIDIYSCREMNYFYAFSVLIIICVPFAIDRALAFNVLTSHYLKIFIIFFMVVLTIRSNIDFLRLISMIIASGCFISLLTIRNKIYGLHLVEQTRVTLGGLPEGVLSDPNDLALILLFPLSFSISLFVTPTGSFFNRLVGFVSTFLLIAAVVATESRGGLYGVVAVLIYFISIKVKSKRMLFVVALILGVFFYQVAHIGSRITTQSPEGQIDESAQIRLDAWKAAMNMAIHHPLFGVGPGGFMDNFQTYSWAEDNHPRAVHSLWFGVMAETGFLGFFVFLGCAYMALESVRYNQRMVNSLDPVRYPVTSLYSFIARGLYGGLIGFFVSSSFLSSLYSWSFYMFFALSIAFTRILHDLHSR